MRRHYKKIGCLRSIFWSQNGVIRLQKSFATDSSVANPLIEKYLRPIFFRFATDLGQLYKSYLVACDYFATKNLATNIGIMQRIFGHKVDNL